MSAEIVSLFARRVARVTERAEPRLEPAAVLAYCKLRVESNPRNRYDAAFKGLMARRAWELIRTLKGAMCEFNSLARRNALTELVIIEIEKMRDDVLRTTPEHHPPAG